MSSNNEQLPSEKTSKTDLLDELESIKGLLDDDLDIDIPILDDVVESELGLEAAPKQPDLSDSLANQASSLLDLNRIFDDEAENDSTETSIVDRLNLKGLNPNITIPDFKLNTEAETTPLSPEDPNYEEEQEEMFAEFEMAPAVNDSPAADEEVNLDLLIQEIVDEFIPTIEDQLRQRLSQCSPAVIKQLAKKHLED